MREFCIEALIENLEQVLSFIGDCLEETGCSAKLRLQIDVAVEEIFVNIASYAYYPETGSAVICAEITEEPRMIVIKFIDRGKPYNPLAKPDPDVTASIDERNPGGLGIFMTKKYMDEMEYEYKDGQNILTMKKKIE